MSPSLEEGLFCFSFQTVLCRKRPADSWKQDVDPTMTTFDTLNQESRIFAASLGYVGSKECRKILIEGLTPLEYKGWDSAGIALLGKADEIKMVGSRGRMSSSRRSSE